jgi:phosphoribosylformylglycinamidine synthase subunit PurL
MAPVPTSSAWAEDVSLVPLRDESGPRLAEISRRRRWGFDAPELERLRRHFRGAGRDPTDVELAGIAQSWSEHCSYKSSRRILKEHFGRMPRARRVLGTGDAGVVRYAPGWAYALRIESHNHPSAVEPYGGAATGIGGILRDVLAVGARPIALADPLFFGPPDLAPEAVPTGIKSPRYLMEGVIAGIRDYGNRVGVPTVSGGLYFDPAYIVNPLVNVGCVGLLSERGLRPNRAERAGDRLVLVGGLTGRDGIGGVAFASQELDERSEEESRGAVQLGNPIMKEPLIRACLAASGRGLVRSLKDLGGGGLATASGELVHAGGFGSHLDLARVPLREPGLAPWEIWISESQERMVLEVRPSDLEELLGIFLEHDVPATDLGEVTDGPEERIDFRGRPAARLPLAFRVDPPRLRRPRRASRPRLRPAPPSRPPEPPGLLLEELLLAPDTVSREPVIRVYDHEVQGRTILNPLHGTPATPSHGDAAVLRPRATSRTGLAIAVAAHPWACRLDPFEGSRLVVEELARNLYSVGARPDALSDCLNFGNPEDPLVLGAFDRCVRGLAEAATALGCVIPSGNVSFYNGGLGGGIPPTPVLLGVGVVPDLRGCVSSDLKRAGDALYLLGASRPELGGSLYARRRHAPGGALPPADPARLRRLGERLLRLGPRGGVRAVHDVADGGLGVALAEMAFGGNLGFTADLAATGLGDAALALVAEGASRFVVEVDAAATASVERAFRGLAWARLGEVTEGDGTFWFRDRPVASLDRARTYPRWRAGLGPGAPSP